MAPKRLRLAVPLALAALLWPFVAPAAPVQAAPPARTSRLERVRVNRVKAPKIDWYKAKSWNYYLGTIRVPLDYDYPWGTQVEIAMAKLPAAVPSRRIGTLFLNPGGPGGSGVQLALDAASFLSQNVLDRFDIVGFDPRGTNNGTKLKCFDSYRSSVLTLQYLDGVPVTSKARAKYRGAAKKLAQGCSHHGRRIAAAMSTTEVARDLDVLRRAVGDSKLTYFGFSYGTYLGEVYANMFPDRVRAIALDGVIDPVAWRGTAATAKTPMSLRLGAAEGAWKALRKAFEKCRAAGPKYCELADPQASLKQVAAKLRKAPLRTEAGKLTYSDFVGALLEALYSQWGGPEVAVSLVASAKEALSGDQSAEYLYSLVRKVKRSRGFNFPYDNSTDAYSAVMCSESLQPYRQSTWAKAIAKRSKKAPYFAEAWGWSDLQCARQYWTARDEDRYRGSFSKVTSKPVLLVGNYYDPATPYSGALAAHRRMPNSWLLKSNSWGHTAYESSSCVTRQVDTYLLRGRKPDAKVCRGDYVPFADPLEDDDPPDSPLSMSKPAAFGRVPDGALG